MAGKCPWLFDHLHRGVAGLNPARGQKIEPRPSPHFERAQRQPQLTGRQCLLAERPRAGDNQRRHCAAPLQSRQSGQTLLARAAAPTDALVGERIGVRQQQNRRPPLFAGREPTGQLVTQLLRPLAAPSEQNHRTRTLATQTGDHQRARRRKHRLGNRLPPRHGKRFQPRTKGRQTSQQIGQTRQMHQGLSNM